MSAQTQKFGISSVVGVMPHQHCSVFLTVPCHGGTREILFFPFLSNTNGPLSKIETWVMAEKWNKYSILLFLFSRFAVRKVFHIFPGSLRAVTVCWEKFEQIGGQWSRICEIFETHSSLGKQSIKMFFVCFFNPKCVEKILSAHVKLETLRNLRKKCFVISFVWKWLYFTKIYIRRLKKTILGLICGSIKFVW